MMSMDFDKLRTIPGTTKEEVDRISEGILALASDIEQKHSTWEEKIESLVKLAKATGRYLNAETGTDYHSDARRKVLEAYEEFCAWRHEEPYVVDEITALLEKVNNARDAVIAPVGGIETTGTH